MKKLLILLIAVAQLGCSPNQTKTDKASKSPAKPLIIFDSDKDDGLGADIRLSITEVNENDTAKMYKAVSGFSGGNLGLLVTISKKPEKGGFGDAIILGSMGQESDNLLQELSKLYKQDIGANAKFKKSVQTSFVNLNVFAKNLGGTVKNDDQNVIEYKLFFGDDEGELYININEKDRWLEIREKDEEYRPVIIKALTQ